MRSSYTKAVPPKRNANQRMPSTSTLHELFWGSRRRSTNSIDKPGKVTQRASSSWDDMLHIQFDDVLQLGCERTTAVRRDRWIDLDRGREKPHCSECEASMPTSVPSREHLYFPLVRCKNPMHLKNLTPKTSSDSLKEINFALESSSFESRHVQRRTPPENSRPLKLPPLRAPSPWDAKPSRKEVVLRRRYSLSPRPGCC